MDYKSKLKKRVVIFLLVPLLSTVHYFTDDLFLNIASTVILLIYVGLIIFLRDKLSIGYQNSEYPDVAPEPEFSNSTIQDEIQEKEKLSGSSQYQFDDGEEFTIISGSKDVDVITADQLTGKAGKRKQTNFFKPPDLKENYLAIANEKYPSDLNHEAQFEYILEKILQIVKEAYIAHSVVFFWFNREKEIFTLDKFVSSSEEISKIKFELEDDVLSRIVKNEEPELLSEIPSKTESDQIRYYAAPQGIKSFIGVPLYFKKHITAILAMDAKEKDSFGIETIYSLGKVVKLISILIEIYNEKYEDHISNQRLSAILNILSGDKQFGDEAELLNTIENSVKNLIAWDAFAFVYYNPSEKCFKTAKVVNKTSLKYVGENLKVDVEDTLVGKAVLSGSPVKIDDTSVKDFIRYSKSEDTSFDGSFLAIPLVYNDQNYGVLCFESLKKGVYITGDVKFMKSITKIFSFIVYSYSTQKVLKNLLSIDIETKVLNRDNFINHFHSDLIKAKKLNVPGSVALIHIDKFIEQDTLFENDPFPRVLVGIGNMIKDELSETSIIGRFNERTFIVYNFGIPAKDTYMWVERLRQSIARTTITTSTRQSTFTVSCGVASTTDSDNVDEILHNVELALNNAIDKGGNQVVNLN